MRALDGALYTYRMRAAAPSPSQARVLGHPESARGVRGGWRDRMGDRAREPSIGVDAYASGPRRERRAMPHGHAPND